MSTFSVLPTIDGFDVIDNATGHTVDHRDTAQSANGVAYALNGAASNPSDARSLWGTRWAAPERGACQSMLCPDERNALRATPAS